MKDITLKKSNDLVNARYYLPINTQKLVCLCASKIQGNDTNFETLEITASEFQAVNKTLNPYRDLKDASEHLFNAYIYGIDKNGKFTEKKRWITTIRYYEGEGKVLFKFHDDLKDWLLQLKINYINYHLESIESLFNKYSLRIYELLILNETVNDEMYSFTISLDSLKELLIIEDKYSNISDLKRYVLDPVIDELNLTNLKNVSYKSIRKGRNIVALEFNYNKDNQLLENKSIK